MVASVGKIASPPQIAAAQRLAREWMQAQGAE